MLADADTRAEVLRYASALTSNRADTVLVLSNASVILAWLEEAKTRKDMEARTDALLQHFKNTLLRLDPAIPPVTALPLTDNPAAFIEGANTLYGFLTAGATQQDTDPGPAADTDVPDWLIETDHDAGTD